MTNARIMRRPVEIRKALDKAVSDYLKYYEYDSNLDILSAQTKRVINKLPSITTDSISLFAIAGILASFIKEEK